MKATDEKGFFGGFWVGFWTAVSLMMIAYAAISLSSCSVFKPMPDELILDTDSIESLPIDMRSENLPLYYELNEDKE